MKYIITRASIINEVNRKNKYYPNTFKRHKPCKGAYIDKIKNNEGEVLTRYFIDIQNLEELEALGIEYKVDILLSCNLDFNNHRSLILYDEVLAEELFNYN